MSLCGAVSNSVSVHSNELAPSANPINLILPPTLDTQPILNLLGLACAPSPKTAGPDPRAGHAANAYRAGPVPGPILVLPGTNAAGHVVADAAQCAGGVGPGRDGVVGCGAG